MALARLSRRMDQDVMGAAGTVHLLAGEAAASAHVNRPLADPYLTADLCVI